jgi:hypothetical protein
MERTPASGSAASHWLDRSSFPCTSRRITPQKGFKTGLLEMMIMGQGTRHALLLHDKIGVP